MHNDVTSLPGVWVIWTWILFIYFKEIKLGALIYANLCEPLSRSWEDSDLIGCSLRAYCEFQVLGPYTFTNFEVIKSKGSL